MANLALKEQYHFDSIQPYSPQFKEMEIEKQKVRISFSSIGKLSVKGKQINSFNLAGADQIFYTAKATLTKTGEIVLQSENFPVQWQHAIVSVMKNSLLHNLQRSKAQSKLLQSIEANYEDMQNIIKTTI